MPARTPHRFRVLRHAAACLLLLALLLAGGTVAAQEVPVVYVRCARTTAELDVTGTVVRNGVSQTVTRHMRGLDVYDVLPDVTHFFGGFSAPCDLVLRSPGGAERVLYDCSSTATDANTCAAMDPSVSFDGRRIAFTVFRGSITHPQENVHAKVIDPLAENNDLFPTRYPNRILSTTEARLHWVDVASGTVTALPHRSGDFDAGPAWLADGRIAFTSSRDKVMSTLVHGTTASSRVGQIWTMDLDGRNADLASHHSLAADQHPFVLRDGRIAYSSWQIFGARPFKYGNGSVGGFDTLLNLFHIYTQNPDGSNPFAFYGQHSGDHYPSSTTGIQHLAAHFITQTSDQRVWFNEYYRGNNNGLGAVLGVMPEPIGQEGLSPISTRHHADLYAVRDGRNLASWATSGDHMANVMPAPAMSVPTYADPLPFAGKLGHPAALPDNRLMVTWGKGACSTNSGSAVFASLGMTAPPLTNGAGQGTAMNVITSINRDTPGCDAGLYRAGAIPLPHPNGLQVIVDSRQWHEIQARAVVPYSAIHGVSAPVKIERSDRRSAHAALPSATPFGLLGAGSILDRETHPAGGIHFAGEHQFQLQGTDTINYSDDALCGVRIIGVQPNRGTQTHSQLHNLSGERVMILGEFPVRHFNGAGTALMDPSGNPDTSFLVRFPANMPYLMQGIDCHGRTLNTDQTWQSLRPGETKTCGGCHVHSKPARVDFAQTRAAAPDFPPVTLGEGSVPLLAGGSGANVTTRTVPGYGLQVEFLRDVMPIFQQRCVSCHSSASPAGNLALDVPGTHGPATNVTPSTWWCLVDDRSQSCLPAAARFNTNAGSNNTTFRRPQVSRYIRAFNALGSLLYWKAAGQRTDGNTDATYTSASPVPDRDLDFGPAHAPAITPEELGILSRWIDLGAPGGAGELSDTQKPTLTVGAVTSLTGTGLVGVRVGMVDVPTGIDPASLRVCIADGNGVCGPNLATGGVNHGVVTVPFANALTTPLQEIEVRVLDRAGNETIIRRTVQSLLHDLIFVSGFEP
ncbi:hypothetical protein [Tahibacter amnicola]|uniref:Hydrazine synthase alpha subunit middle domain-containing protein n=1 Tax=Tahibacter amnicola TaxID=2976241 RepID=A0ABY6BKY7_9GAMM|nr:hypothetical protein [Tahibacter amnicola]UXI70530.1 hypothetical protein N4264_13090 [Tahibacter amnicola]